MITIIPEEVLIGIAKESVEQDCTFTKLLSFGVRFKEAGLHPIYLWSQDNAGMTATSVERVNKQLH